MTKSFLIAGVAALAIAAPVAAKPEKQGDQGGGGKPAKVERAGGGGGAMKADKGHAKHQSTARQSRQEFKQGDRSFREAGKAQQKFEQRVAKSEQKLDKQQGKLVKQELKQREKLFRNDAERAGDFAEQRRLRDLGGDGFDRRFARSGFFDGCPPGLVPLNGGCMPPGQYKKLMLGQALPARYGDSLLPLALRDLYRDTDDHYYRYGNGYAYRVDRGTNLVAALLPLLGGGYSVGQPFPTSFMNSQVPDYYRAFYPDTGDDYYRYANGYIYEVDSRSGMIEDIVPAYGYGYGVGDMMPASYGYYNVPTQYRSFYPETNDLSYRYAPGAIYQVDRQSSLITAIASLLSPGFSVGQPLPMGYDTYNLPYQYRSQYADTPDSWYRYSNGSIYQVDPTTRLVTAVVDAII